MIKVTGVERLMLVLGTPLKQCKWTTADSLNLSSAASSYEIMFAVVMPPLPIHIVSNLI